jgi:hypothetical protein
MKRLLLLSLLFFATFHSSIAQSLEGTVEYQRTKQPAAILELPYSADLLEDAFKNIFSKQGSKGNESKGFLVFPNKRSG